jgi:hypothetical protein
VPFIPSILPNVSSYTVKDDMLSVEWPGTAASLFMIANLSTNTVVADELDGAQVLFSTAREQHASEQIEPWEVRLLLRTNS